MTKQLYFIKLQFQHDIMAAKVHNPHPHQIYTRPSAPNHDSQAGITLIMSILILTAIAAISFSLGALVIREIKSSRYLAQTEPAISTAEAGAESALFFRLRQIASYNSDCPTATTGTLPSGPNYSVCTKFYENPYIFATSSSSLDVIILDDPTNSSTIAAGYTSLSITATSGSASTIRVEAYDLDAASPLPLTTTVIVPGTGTLTNLDPAKRYAVFLIPIPPFAGFSNPSASGSVTANGGSKGIPSKFPKISSSGTKSNLVRKLEIQLRR